MNNIFQIHKKKHTHTPFWSAVSYKCTTRKICVTTNERHWQHRVFEKKKCERSDEEKTIKKSATRRKQGNNNIRWNYELTMSKTTVLLFFFSASKMSFSLWLCMHEYVRWTVYTWMNKMWKRVRAHQIRMKNKNMNKQENFSSSTLPKCVYPLDARIHLSIELWIAHRIKQDRKQ